MIQRIQTIYLLLVAIACTSFIFIPFGELKNATSALSVLMVKNYPTDMIGTIVIALIAVVSIFLYGNRKQQMKIVLLNCVLSVVFIGWIAYGIVQHVGWSNYGFKIGVLLPVFILLFNLLAYGSIKSDEKLVRSMDRLR
ncbi:MAG TPA: DUF4293 domain-containing protein [Chitinophagales bacterium]|nr:DUF4293 domain-containing protein [Chitinophagales bacterium]